jgi:hypothetical protein
MKTTILIVPLILRTPTHSLIRLAGAQCQALQKRMPANSAPSLLVTANPQCTTATANYPSLNATTSINA